MNRIDVIVESYLLEDMDKFKKTHGIVSVSHPEASIGWSEDEQKWYGWSHRAVYGYKIGDVVKKGHCGAEYLGDGFTAKTIDDCKKMAIAFSKSVS
jgi:hypothetical protein